MAGRLHSRSQSQSQSQRQRQRRRQSSTRRGAEQPSNASASSCNKRIAKAICLSHGRSEGADVQRHQSPVHEVDVRFSSHTSHEVMPVLARVVCTVARLEQLQLRGLSLRRAPALETLAADLQRARRALQHALIQVAVQVAAEWCAWGAQRKRELERRASWFAVFPRGVRPLSTTWPWTIRPALAVLWGVCWQYYPPSASLFGTPGGGGGDEGGGGRARTRVRAARLGCQLDLGLGWQAPHDGAYLQFGREALATTLAQGGLEGREALGSVGAGDDDDAAGGLPRPLQQRRRRRRRRRAAEGPASALGLALDVRNSNHPHPRPPRTARCATSRHVSFQDAQPQLRRNPRPQGSSSTSARGSPSQPAQPSPSPASTRDPPPPSPAGHLYANALSPNASPAHAQACFRPYQSGIATFESTHRTPHVLASTPSPAPTAPTALDWLAVQPSCLNLNTAFQASELRVEHFTAAALQPTSASVPTALANDYIFANAPSPPRALVSLPPSYASPMDAAVAHVPQVMPEFSKSSGPVSPVSMNEDVAVQMSPTATNSAAIAANSTSRKRKLSDVSLTAQPVQPANSQLPIRESSEEQDRYEGYTPRGKYSHKRTEDPPRNAEGKMVCTFSPDCHGLTFERKCEWSKHMDKHDRPYVCRHKGCEKLQGFTYSGGLLRHEREVHKMHGGTKKALFCPHQDCKRSMGQGFTRKENLAEHIRRVHRRASNSDAASSPNAQPGGQSKPEDEVASETGLSPDAEADDVYGGAVGERRVAPAPSKRRRTSGTDGGGSIGGGGGETDEDDLREEIMRLRRENEEKDQRLKKLEEAVNALSRGQGAPTMV